MTTSLGILSDVLSITSAKYTGVIFVTLRVKSEFAREIVSLARKNAANITVTAGAILRLKPVISLVLDAVDPEGELDRRRKNNRRNKN